MSLGVIAMLTGCDVTKVRVVQTALESILVINDRVQALFFEPNKLAPTYSEAEVLKPLASTPSSRSIK